MEYLVLLFLKDWVVLFCVEHVKLVDELAPASGQAGGRAGRGWGGGEAHGENPFSSLYFL